MSEKALDVWEYILKFINYSGSGEIIVTSEQIKESGKSNKNIKSQFEPRLLCKQDTSDGRPEIFKKYGLYIISIKNGTYLLTNINTYECLHYNNDVLIEELDKNTESLILSIGNSETSLIDNIRYSGLFESEYLNEKIKYGPLLNGRHRCSFQTKIGDKDLKIEGVQYETDSCYESDNKILLIEGKSGNPDTFNIRQLYFPYRSIYDSIGDKKEIICFFITKDKKNIIQIWTYKFENPLVMTSIKCLNYRKYIFC